MPLRPYTVRVQVNDLLLSCPAFSLGCERLEHCKCFPWHLFDDLRRRWSHTVIEIAAPVPFCQVPLYLDTALFWRMLGYTYCRSDSFWRVVGRKALMDELAQLPKCLCGGSGVSL